MPSRPVQARVAMQFSGALSSMTLSASGLAYCGSLSVAGTATIGTSLAVSGPISGASFSGVGTSLTSLDASNLSSGTVPVGRLGSSGSPGATTFLRGDNSWQTAVTAVSVVTANGVSASVATQGTTPELTFTLGAITPTSIESSGTISGTTITGTTMVAGVFIPAQTTIPTFGFYAGSAGGVALATNGVERLEITSAGLMTISAVVVEIPNEVAASTIDCSKGNYFTKTYFGSQTWAFVNAPPSGVVYKFVLRLQRGSSGTQTWPSSVRWTGGNAPNLTNSNGGNDIFEFLTEDGGVTWRAWRNSTSTK